jgi:hypothetical protein
MRSMSLNGTRRSLTAASILILMTAAGLLFWGLRPLSAVSPSEALNHSPRSSGDSRTQASGTTKAGVNAQTPPSPGIAELAGLLDRPLRRPLFDPPPPPPKIIEKKQLPPIRARLLATMVERDSSTAVLRLATGEVVFRQVGQHLGADEPDVTIARIEAGSISVKRDGDETRLLVDGQKGH